VLDNHTQRADMLHELQDDALADFLVRMK